MQEGAVQPHGFTFPECGPLQMENRVPQWSSSSGPVRSREGSGFRLSLQRWAASNVYKYPILLCWLYHFPHKQTRSHFPSEPSGFDRCLWLFLGPLLKGKKGGNILNWRKWLLMVVCNFMGWEMNCPSSPQLPSAPLIVICICSLGSITSLLAGSAGIVAFWGRKFRCTFTLDTELSGLLMLLRHVTLVSETKRVRSSQPLLGT